MQSEPKYESLDIEQLLLHKSFYELADDEREFAMQHIDSEQEYEDMRKTLLNIGFSTESEELIAPPPRIKEELMAAFDEESNKKPIVIWLNSIGAVLFPEGKSFYRQPGFQTAMAAMIVIAFLVLGPMDDPSIAGDDMVASNETQQGQLDEKTVTTDATILEEVETTEEETGTRIDNNGNTLVAEANNAPSPAEDGAMTAQQKPAVPPALLDDSEILVADVPDADEDLSLRELADNEGMLFGDPGSITNQRDKDANAINGQGSTGTGSTNYEDNLAQGFEFKGKVTTALDSTSFDRFQADELYKSDAVEDEIADNLDNSNAEVTFDADDIAFAQPNLTTEKEKLKKEQDGAYLGGVRGGTNNTVSPASTGGDNAGADRPNALLEIAAQSTDNTNKNNVQKLETVAEVAEVTMVEAEEMEHVEEDRVTTTASTISTNRVRPDKAAKTSDVKNTDLIKGRSLNDDKALIKTFFTAL